MCPPTIKKMVSRPQASLMRAQPFQTFRKAALAADSITTLKINVCQTGHTSNRIVSKFADSVAAILPASAIVPGLEFLKWVRQGPDSKAGRDSSRGVKIELSRPRQFWRFKLQARGVAAVLYAW